MHHNPYFRSGAHAYLQHSPITACPWNLSHGERQLWIAGWQDAEHRMRKVSRMEPGQGRMNLSAAEFELDLIDQRYGDQDTAPAWLSLVPASVVSIAVAVIIASVVRAAVQWWLTV